MRIRLCVARRRGTRVQFDARTIEKAVPFLLHFDRLQALQGWLRLDTRRVGGHCPPVKALLMVARIRSMADRCRNYR
jgi:hypothetical protein